MHRELNVADAPNAVEKHRRYMAMVDRIRDVALNTLPPGANVLVVSKGDDALLALGSARAGHFPQTDDGRYGGFHPKTSEEAIAHLEELRGRGAEYLLIPATAMWWLEHYEDLREHLETQYRRIAAEPDTCMVFRLREPAYATSARRSNGAAVGAAQLDSLVAALLPADASVAIATSASVSERYVTWALPSEHRGDDLTPSIASSLSALADSADFLVVPAAGLEDRVERPLRAALERRFRLITDQANVCSIFRLSPTPAREWAAVERRGPLADVARILFPPGSTVAVASAQDAAAVESAGARAVAFTSKPANGKATGNPDWLPDAEFIVLRKAAPIVGSTRAQLEERGGVLLLWRDSDHSVYARIERDDERS